MLFILCLCFKICVCVCVRVSYGLIVGECLKFNFVTHCLWLLPLFVFLVLALMLVLVSSFCPFYLFFLFSF